MPTYTTNQYYLGNFTTLDPLESSDADVNNAQNENTTATNTGGGTSFGPSSVFDNTELSLVSVQQNDTVREGATGRLEEDDYQPITTPWYYQVDPDTLTYDVGGGPVTSALDSLFSYNVTVVLGDGTSVTMDLFMIQTVNGDIFTYANTELDNLTVQSITLNYPSTGNYSDYYGAGVNASVDNGGVVCLAAGTLILTDRGEVAIEKLTAGDMIKTMDHGFQPVRWIGSRHLDRIDLAANPKLLPIRIAAGCLGENLPHRDLLVSPQHRILVRSKIAQRMFGTQEVLGAAKQFLRLDGFDIVQNAGEVTYYHLLFDQHEIIFAEGAPTESLFTGPVALESVGAEARDEILAIMPEIAEAGREIEGARMLLPGGLARRLASRHRQNRKLLLSDARSR